ncbi:Vitamin K-dependent gamma-carboxylase [Nannocystis exedens]|uniref:Vitamin K-dependent gamma-carboxylase n=1 Tax=Nannocystis exedens TaxID=54 RepID=A0A1I1ZNR9_9BACT|nr:HTTM domain-containing protein [Nannocystis exedens]PCC75413.1 Vitamin K-dependent gamma-carboxylase [Nannocystis exedens]SFE32988.1 Vitamin K-dependent gamma-carboxylase [Nannocystis exedens]
MAEATELPVFAARARAQRGPGPLARFFFATEGTARTQRFARGLALWTGAYALTQWPHREELYSRPVLRDGWLEGWLGGWVPPPALVTGLLALLAVAAGTAAAGRGGRAARVTTAGLFGLLVGLEASAPRAYAALAVLQWSFVALAPAGPRGPRWAARLLMLQLSAVYVFAALSKLAEGTSWWTGEAIVLIFRSARQGQHLLSAWLPLTPGPLAQALAWSTIALELAIGCGLWFARTRRPAAIALVLLHAGIAGSMRVSLLFHALMLLHLLLFFGRRGDEA